MPRRDSRTRVLVATAAVASGLIIGVIVISLVGSGESKPATYQPFFAGRADRITNSIVRDGPIFYPDPKGGTRAFYLDLEKDQVVALRIVPPGGNSKCIVEWDRRAKRYEDCEDRPIDASALHRYLVRTRTQGENELVYVDLRTLLDAPGNAPTPAG